MMTKNYIRINLSFFESGDKTEKPTSRKKSKSREEGQVARSKEIGAAFLFIFGFIALKNFGGFFYRKLSSVFRYNLVLIGDIDKIFTVEYLTAYINKMFTEVIVTVSPIFVTVIFVGLVTNIIQVGWHPTTKPLKPKLSAFNPVSGFKKIISKRSLVELLKSLLKIILISYVIYTSIKGEIHNIQMLINMSVIEGLAYICTLSVDLGIKTGIYFILIAIIDYAYERYSHNKKLKMSKQEVKDEYKMTEGDPKIKGKIKQKMREVSMRRMMQDIPNADVIITNPTHYAVALKYERDKALAPILVAKGVDHLAKKIKAIATENNVEIVENKQLARALYNTVDVGREIPPELYQAVAEVLAYVYRLKNAS